MMVDIVGYEECCGLKIAAYWKDYYVYENKKCYEEEVQDVISFTKQDCTDITYNNRILIAWIANQKKIYLPLFLEAIKKDKIGNLKMKLIHSFINPKTGNKIWLYCLYRTPIRKTKKKADA